MEIEFKYIQDIRRDKMFKIKRPAIIGLLVVLLLFTTFLNYQLTQQSILKASKGYEEFELGEMDNINNEKDVFSEGLPYEEDNDNVQDEILEQEEKNKDINEVISSRDENIEDVLEKDGDNYFVDFRLSRDKIRAESIDRLDSIIDNEMTEQSVRNEAQQEVINIGKITEKELQIEGLIQSKGFDDALVFLTTEDIKIVVSTDELNEQEMVMILDIVKSETNLEMENIKIMKKH